MLIKTFLGGKQLALELVKPHHTARASLISLPRNLQKRLRQDDHNSAIASSPRDATYKRCHIYPRGRDRKTKTVCVTCKNHVCKEHIISKCSNLCPIMQFS